MSLDNVSKLVCKAARFASIQNSCELVECLQFQRPLVLFLLLTLLGLSSSPAESADQKYWELSPYRVQLHLAVDDSQRPQPELGSELVTALQQRIRATLYPLWSTEIHLSTGLERERLLTQLPRLETLPAEKIVAGELSTEATGSDRFITDEMAVGCDKRIFLNIVATPLGISLTSRELDCLTRRWSAIQERQLRQSWMLPEQCFDLLCQTFAPLATIRPLPTDANNSDKNQEHEILLRFRGSDLPQQTDLSFLTLPGEVYQPLMVRTSSAGAVRIDSIREIPWTYLTLTEQKKDGWHGDVHTGTRRPFGVRRRGRIEHVALAVRNPKGKTKVRFFARHDANQGLSGYEVFRREPAATNSQPLGLTDPEGVVQLLPGDSKVALLFLRSEGQLLAKVPVVPGAKPLIEVPVADDTARLRAQASLTSLTERLIDTVAQRNILIARVRDRLKSGQIDAAQELYSDLDSLPGRAQFDQLISSAENRKLHQSDDPKVQARIEKLFADTRKLLGRFLSTKQITQLQGELSAARRSKSS